MQEVVRGGERLGRKKQGVAGLDNGVFKPRYLASVKCMLRAATPLYHPEIGESDEPGDDQVQLRKTATTNGGKDASGNANKPNAMHVQKFRKMPTIVNGATIWVPIVQVKSQIRQAIVNSFIDMCRAQGIGRWSDFIKRSLRHGIFNVQARATILKKRGLLTAKQEKDYAAAEEYIKSTTWKGVNYEEVGRRCNIRLLPAGHIVGACFGRPARSMFSGDMFMYAACSEMMEMWRNEIAPLGKYSEVFDVDASNPIWIPAKDFLFRHRAGAGRGREEDGEQQNTGTIFSQELAKKNTAWFLSFENNPRTLMNSIEVEIFARGLQEFALKPYVGGRGGRVDCLALVLTIRDTWLGQEEVYVGSWTTSPLSGLTFKRAGGKLNLGLEHLNNGNGNDGMLAKFIAANKESIAKIAQVDLTEEGLKQLSSEVLRCWQKDQFDGEL